MRRGPTDDRPSWPCAPACRRLTEERRNKDAGSSSKYPVCCMELSAPESQRVTMKKISTKQVGVVFLKRYSTNLTCNTSFCKIWMTTKSTSPYRMVGAGAERACTVRTAHRGKRVHKYGYRSRVTWTGHRNIGLGHCSASEWHGVGVKGSRMQD